MEIHLSDEQAAQLLQTLDFLVDDLDTKIETTDNLAWRGVLRERRDHLDLVRRQLVPPPGVRSTL